MTEKYVLLVEDNPDDVTLTELAFKKAQITNRLVVVGDGAEALEFLFCRGQYDSRKPQDKPVVIMLDLKLPMVSGLEVLKAIRSDKNTLDIPVVVLTSSMEAHDQRASYRLGISDYLQKPTGLSNFIEMIRKIKMQFLD